MAYEEDHLAQQNSRGRNEHSLVSMLWVVPQAGSSSKCSYI